MNNDKIEILAPAGGFDSVVAAVRCGADAVYLGAKEFSARASAQNFDDDELVKAAEYCHQRNVLVYLTVNTVVFDSELEGVAKLIKQACRAGIDAVIVQNMGVAMMIKEMAPKLPLHGSTQMSVHTLSGAKALYEMGFKRVVLARELTKDEIRTIAEGCTIELEVFVHGALCMSMSGQCYFSAMLGSRSGSRGACAQPCRLPFSVGRVKDCHALSLKDNSIIDYLGELQAMGVASAKIEGRMKRPEYVACAVRACVESRDWGGVSPETQRLLESVFSRTGFTDGYYTDRRGKDMFGFRRKENVVSADEKLFSKIRRLYKDENQRVKVSFELNGKIGENPVLTVSDGCNRVKITGDTPCQRAVNKPLSEEKCKAQLEKTGSTQYYPEKIICSLEQGVTMPLSAINKLRRQALEELDKIRGTAKKYSVNEPSPLPRLVTRNKPIKRYARVKSAKIEKAFKDFDMVFVPVFTSSEQLVSLKEQGYKIGVEIPPAMFSLDDKIAEALKNAKNAGINDVYCPNIGAVYLAHREDMRIHGGFRLNFTNSRDILWAESMGFADAELSVEITINQIKELRGSLPVGIVSYGYLPLMLTRNCPNKCAGISCKACKGKWELQDRKGKKFILLCGKSATEILNCVPLKMTDKADLFENISFHTYSFTVENYVESVETIGEIHSYLLDLKDFTRGLYFRGVK